MVKNFMPHKIALVDLMQKNNLQYDISNLNEAVYYVQKDETAMT